MADLVPELCDGCSGRGVVGNILDTRECDWCNGTGFADPESVTPQDHTPPKLKAVLADALAKIKHPVFGF